MHKEQKHKQTLVSRKRVLLFVLLFAIALLGTAMFIVTQKNLWLSKEYDRREEYIRERELLAMLNLNIREAESGTRGYVLTGNEAFIANINRTVTHIKNQTGKEHTTFFPT